MIRLQDLTKTFRTHKRPPGVAAAFRSLFHRTYEETTAVEKLSLEIADGARVGFLGPNGAGKTTTLKMLSGLLHPTSGTCEVAGFTPKDRKRAFLESITLVMGQKQQLMWDLPASETFELNRAIYEVPRARFDETVKELGELLELGDLVNKPVRQLSLGERMKCELIAALLHRPKVLFLDEPTIGLDVSMQVVVRAFIKTYNERHGATVLLTSHYMEDVLALCPRVVVIDKGRLIFDGAVDALVRSVRPEKRVSLKLSKPVDKTAAQGLGEIIEHEAGKLVLSVKPEHLGDVVKAALAKLPVADLAVEDPPLEDIMRELFARGKAEKTA